MTEQDFIEVFNNRVYKCKQLLMSKNAEYARGGDKLSNFKKAAGLQSCTPERALQGMMAKHQVSINDMIQDLGDDIYSPLSIWDEKLNDAINYLFLLDALIQERWQQETKLDDPLPDNDIPF